MHLLTELVLFCHTNLRMVGSEKPIGSVSVTLTDTEKKYTQVEKEGLACIFGLSRFYTYLFGHKLTLVTDNKALVSLFDPSRNVSPQVSGRIQCDL